MHGIFMQNHEIQVMEEFMTLLSRELTCAHGETTQLLIFSVNKLGGKRFLQEKKQTDSSVLRIREYLGFEGRVMRSSLVPLSCSGGRCTLNMSTLKRPPIGVLREGELQLRCRPRHLTVDQNEEVRRQ
ncbi:hypothetical protein TNCV_1738241 [Trichonephila clavipes]|nr:hypothetical protein TNCV_1738241 [Trichonephila clavipes]